MKKLEQKIKTLSLLKSIPIEILENSSSRELKEMVSELNLKNLGDKETIIEFIKTLKKDKQIPQLELIIKKEHSSNILEITKADLKNLIEYTEQLVNLIDLDILHYIEEEKITSFCPSLPP